MEEQKDFSEQAKPVSNLPKQELPNSTGVLVLGILSIVFCWCYGIPGLVLGIIALVMSKKQQYFTTTLQIGLLRILLKI